MLHAIWYIPYELQNPGYKIKLTNFKLHAFKHIYQWQNLVVLPNTVHCKFVNKHQLFKCANLNYKKSVDFVDQW